MFFALFFGSAFLTFALASFPWIAIALVHDSEGRIRLDHPEDRKMTVTWSAFLIPIGVLFALADRHNLDWRQLIPWALAISAALTFANVRVLPGPVSKWRVFTLLVAYAFYGYSVAEAINTRFDPSPAAVSRSRVIEKERTKRILSRRSYYYSLTLEPWGPYPEGNKADISDSEGESLEPGDEVCLTLHRGVLQISWFTAKLCGR